MEPSFGVGLSFWVFPALLAATFLGWLPGVTAGVVSTVLIGLTSQQFFDPSEGALSLAMVIFVATYLHANKSLRVVDGVCFFWLFATPCFIFYHRALWLLDLNGGILVLAREVISHLLPALLVQLITLKPAFYTRWFSASALRTNLKSDFTLTALARIVLIPATLMPVMLAAQVFTTESLFIRQQSFLNQAEQLSIAHARQAELALSKTRMRALAAPSDRASTYEAWAAALLADMPWVCAINHQRFKVQVAAKNTDAGATDICNMRAESIGRSAIAAFRLEALTVWVDLDRLSRVIEADEREAPFYHASRLWQGSVDAGALGGTQVMMLADTGRSRIEALFRRKSVRVDLVDDALFDAPIYAQVDVVLNKPTDIGLAVSVWSLLTTFVFMLVLFLLYRRWLGLSGRAIEEFVHGLSDWRVGHPMPTIKALPVGLLQELDILTKAFARLVDNVNRTYQALDDISVERRALIGRMSTIYRSIHAPIFVFDAQLQLDRSQSNLAAVELIDELMPVFDTAKRQLDTRTLVGQEISHSALAPSPAGIELANVLFRAVAFRECDAEVELAIKNTKRGNESVYLCGVDVITSEESEATELFGLVLVLSDITELTQSRQQLMHSAKMTSVGEVASGAAHELNQPLNIIRMATHNLLRSLSLDELKPEQLRAKLDRINTQVDRAARLVSGMKAFARTSNQNLTLSEPSEAISVALDLLGKRVSAAEIELTYCPLDKSIALKTDVSALQHIVISMVDNAIDAFVAGTVKGRRLKVTESLQAGDFVLTLQDNAGGIESQVIDRIFEPFFTTRPELGNSGLGLSSSYGIVKDLGGSITAENDEQGAVFTVRLPIAVDNAQAPDTNDEPRA